MLKELTINGSRQPVHCGACRHGRRGIAFTIPSAVGPPPRAHGETAPKRATKEFFKDLLAGGIAGIKFHSVPEVAVKGPPQIPVNFR